MSGEEGGKILRFDRPGVDEHTGIFVDPAIQDKVLEVAQELQAGNRQVGQLPVAQNAELALDQHPGNNLVAAAAFLVLVNFEELPVQIRAIIADRILPEARDRRRSVDRYENIDWLTEMGNARAFDLAMPTADADPDVEYVLLDGRSLGLINDTVSWNAGTALAMATADSIKAAAIENGTERYFRYGGDDFAVLTNKGTALTIIESASRIFNARIDTGEPLVDKHDVLYPLSLFADYQLGMHSGYGLTFKQAWAMVQKSKQESSHKLK